jgi:hypothetical protein
MAFCVECGSRIESEWKFCSDCSAPVKKAAKSKSTPGATEIQKVADRILDPVSYGHWLTAGKPFIIESYGEVLGFDLKNIDDKHWFEYLAYARHSVGKKAYKEWVHAKYPVLGRVISYTDLPKRPKDSKEVAPKDATKLLTPYALDIWKKAGKPRIALSPSRPDEVFFLDWFGWFQWSKVVEPLTEKELLAPFSSAEKTLKDEDEIRELLDRDAFKIWKKRDRPTLIKSFGSVYYKTQLDFKKLFDIEMPPLLLDIWYLAGCPKLKGWNYIASTEEYLGELEDQQSRGSLWSRFANGVGEFSVGLSQGLGQSGGINYNPGQPDYNQIWKCVKCGAQLASQFQVCRYCQETSYGFK